jgi:hypothetical protein
MNKTFDLQISIDRSILEDARIHRQEGPGGQAQGRAGLDEGQDLEANGQEGGHGDAGRGLNALYPHLQIGRASDLNNTENESRYRR